MPDRKPIIVVIPTVKSKKCLKFKKAVQFILRVVRSIKMGGDQPDAVKDWYRLHGCLVLKSNLRYLYAQSLVSH